MKTKEERFEAEVFQDLKTFKKDFELIIQEVDKHTIHKTYRTDTAENINQDISSQWGKDDINIKDYLRKYGQGQSKQISKTIDLNIQEVRNHLQKDFVRIWEFNDSLNITLNYLYTQKNECIKIMFPNTWKTLSQYLDLNSYDILKTNALIVNYITKFDLFDQIGIEVFSSYLAKSLKENDLTNLTVNDDIFLNQFFNTFSKPNLVNDNKFIFYIFKSIDKLKKIEIEYMDDKIYNSWILEDMKKFRKQFAQHTNFEDSFIIDEKNFLNPNNHKFLLKIYNKVLNSFLLYSFIYIELKEK